MEYVKLGKSSLMVSKLCLGCMSFGVVQKNGPHPWVLDQSETDKIIKRALELGINFFDTANIYSNGTSEQFIGNSFKKFVKDRKDIIIATKVFFNEGRLSKEAIKRECEKSLKNLQTDYIDLYIIHRWDYNTDIEETMEALNDLVVSKKVRYIGCSALFAYQLLRANLIARKHGWAEFISIQNHYNLIYREEEREMFQLLEEEGIDMTPYSPLASGRLCRIIGDTKRIKDDPTSYLKYDHCKEEDMKTINRVKEISEKLGCSMSQVALAWVLGKKLVKSPVIGCTSVQQLEELVGALKIKLSDDDVKYLEELYKPHKVVGALKKGDLK